MVVGDIEKGTDVLVIGAGPGGYHAAIRAAQRGKDVTIVEKEKVGGTCLNHGCIPAKAIIHASKFHDDIQHWNEIGIEAECEHVDFEKVQEWKDETVEKLDQGILQIFDDLGIELMKGTAYFEDSNTVRVEEEHNAETVKFDKAVVAAGTKPIEIPSMSFDMDRVISSREVLELEEVPDEIVVIGGGYIGMEAVTKYCKFGATVKVLEAEDRVLNNFEEDIVRHLEEVSPDYGDEIYTNVQAKEVVYNDNNKPVVIAEQEDGSEVEIKGDYVLVAVGRTPGPVVDGLDIENTDVTTGEHGFIETDEQMRTEDDNIFAIGDIVGNPLLAHKAFREGKVAAEVISGKNAAFDNQYIPKAMYTDPEVAVVGDSLEEAEDKYDDVMIGRFPFKASGRALSTNKTDGFVRVIADGNEKLVGVQIVGSRASDMIAEATLALEMQAHLDDLANTIHAHPTFPEALSEAAEAAKDEAIHFQG
jgi:dihydrolipoamide dehydrogenase